MRAPAISATVEVGPNPEALAVSPDGALVAVVTNSAEASELQIVQFANGQFGMLHRFDMAALGVTGGTESPRGGVTATNVHWHPSGEGLAVNVDTQDRVLFVRLEKDGDALRASAWGNVAGTGHDPFVGRFTPDGL